MIRFLKSEFEAPRDRNREAWRPAFPESKRASLHVNRAKDVQPQSLGHAATPTPQEISPPSRGLSRGRVTSLRNVRDTHWPSDVRSKR